MTIANTHRNYSPDWWTPPEWMVWVHETLGSEDVFDPYPKRWTPDGPWDAMRDDWPDAPTYANHPGKRGSAQKHWLRAIEQGVLDSPFIWCAFNIEQLRHLDPSPKELPGWLIEPDERIGFVWGGPDIVKYEGTGPHPTANITRRHGEVAKSPGNWTVFWSTVQPAEPPVPCTVTRTGASWRMGVTA